MYVVIINTGSTRTNESSEKKEKGEWKSSHIFSAFQIAIHVTRCAAVTAFCVLSRMEQKMIEENYSSIFSFFVRAGVADRLAHSILEVCTYGRIQCIEIYLFLHTVSLIILLPIILSVRYDTKMRLCDIWKSWAITFAHLASYFVFSKLNFQ